ncbi:MAG TPA: serine/threonine-protein kinase [Polyangiaceae bacterium]
MPDPARPISTARLQPVSAPALPALRPAAGDALAPSPSPPPADAALPKVCSTCQNHYPEDFLGCPRDATPLPMEGQEGDPLVGKVLGDAYQVLRVVGEGGMGRVYEARHLRLRDRRFAVKVLHPEMARDPEIVARFQREAEASSSIDHPNVVDVFDVHMTQEGQPYLVGEFLDGRELGEQLEKDGPLDVPNAVHVARQVCSALSAAHGRGIVHRDMKPENVFLAMRDDGIHVKVIDFGISKAKETANANLTRTGVVMGTPSYMAPEQARGDKVDARADVYAVGALIYHMLTGKRPFEAEDATATLTLVITEEPARPRSIKASIPEGLELVIQRAMAKDPRERYQSMDELDQAIAPWDTGVPSTQLPVIERTANSTMVRASAPSYDGNARTMVAGVAGSAPTGSVPGSGDAVAKFARPIIVLATLALFTGFIVCVVSALGGVVRMVRAGDLTPIETLLLLIGTFAAATTPLVLFLLRVRKNVWQNSMRAVEVANDLRRTVLAAFTVLGMGAVGTRFAEGIVLRTSSELSKGVWDVALVSAALVAGVVAATFGPLARAWRRRNR